VCKAPASHARRIRRLLPCTAPTAAELARRVWAPPAGPDGGRHRPRVHQGALQGAKCATQDVRPQRQRLAPPLYALHLAAADDARQRAVRRYSSASCRRTRSFPTVSSTCTSASSTRCAPGALRLANASRPLLQPIDSAESHYIVLDSSAGCDRACSRQVEDKGKNVAGDAAADQRMARKPAADGVLDPRLVPSRPARPARCRCPACWRGGAASSPGARRASATATTRA